MSAPASVRMVFREARKRATRKGLEFSITAEDIDTIWARCAGKCELTKIVFEFEAMHGKFVRRPFAPSLDRLDCTQGYTLENMRLVCVIVNFAMNTWGEHALMRVAVGMFENGRQAVRHAGLAPTCLPQDVRLVLQRNRVKYAARARDFGKDTHLGMFDTVDEAVSARLAWARAHTSLKVIRQVHAFTKKPELLNEINSLQNR